MSIASDLHRHAGPIVARRSEFDKLERRGLYVVAGQLYRGERLAQKITGLLKVNGKSALQPAGKTPAEK